jgi:hypothetical protein
MCYAGKRPLVSHLEFIKLSVSLVVRIERDARHLSNDISFFLIRLQRGSEDDSHTLHLSFDERAISLNHYLVGRSTNGKLGSCRGLSALFAPYKLSLHHV